MSISSQPPLLLVHGFGSSLQQWAENLAPLSQTHSVYALDLLGFGMSEKAATAYRVSLWAQQVYEFWQTFIGRPVILVGHSLGALVTATVAVHYPDAVQRVVLLTLPATRQERIAARWAQTLIGSIERIVATPWAVRLIFTIVRQPGIIRKALKAAYVNPEAVTEAKVMSFTTPTRDRGAAQTLCRLTQAATSTDYSLSRRALLARIHQPTLVLWGQQDRIVPVAQGRELRDEFPTLNWIEIPNGGHCVYDECSDIINTTILNWLSNDADARNLLEPI